MAYPRHVPSATRTWWAAVSIALMACAAAAIWPLTDPNNLMVHPENPSHHLVQLLTGGTRVSKWDFITPFSEFDHRARFLTYFLIVLDYRARIFLYQFFPVFPTFSITWLFTLLAAPYVLFRICRKLDFAFYPSVFATAVFATSIGVLSDVSMFFMPGKPMSMFLMLLILLLALDLFETRQSSSPRQLFRRRAQISALIFAGLFLDELFFVVLATIPIICLSARGLSVTGYLRGSGQGQVGRDVLMILAPVAIFLVLMVWGVPKITQHYYGYRLDYMAAMLNTLPLADPRPSHPFSVLLLAQMASTLLGMSVVPYQLSPIVALPDSGVITAQVMNGPQLMLLSAVAGGFLFLLRRYPPPRRPMMSGLALSMAVAIVLISIMQLHHVPVVTGYYYGCIFAVFFALLFGACLDSLSTSGSPAAKWICLGLTVLVCGVQIDNFLRVNRSFVDYHNVRRPAANVSFRSIAEQPLTWSEIRTIHAQWKRGTLEQYLKSATVSDGAWYLVTELRQIDRLRQLNKR
jgi:hypothetical protein